MIAENKPKCASWQSRPGCSCQTCQSDNLSGIGAQHRYWRERKLRWHLPQAPSNFQHGVACACGCATCRHAAQATFDEHLYWRERRRASTQELGEWEALEILQEVPILHMVSTSGQPISAIPGLLREFEAKPLHHAAASKVRTVYVYAPNNSQRCVSPQKWQSAEQYVTGLYQSKPHYGARGQTTIQQKGFITKPDGVLAPNKAGMAKMLLPLGQSQTQSKNELELVEVKRYRTENIPSLFTRLINQVKTRAKVAAPNGATGRYQTIILDFRGQEADCAKIKDAALRVADRLKKSVHGVTILVQVLLWSGPACHQCQGINQTL